MMERGSDKHTPRLDDEMDGETESLTRGSPIESRSDESRMKEPPGDDDPMPQEIDPAGR
jgi:hypothetical protein